MLPHVLLITDILLLSYVIVICSKTAVYSFIYIIKNQDPNVNIPYKILCWSYYSFYIYNIYSPIYLIYQSLKHQYKSKKTQNSSRSN